MTALEISKVADLVPIILCIMGILFFILLLAAFRLGVRSDEWRYLPDERSPAEPEEAGNNGEK